MSTTSPCMHGNLMGSCFFCQSTRSIYADLYSSTPPAQIQPAILPAHVPPSPPSRTSNAASANGAASLLALIESVDKYFSITNRTYPQVEITLPEWQLIKSALQQRIEVSGVESREGIVDTQQPEIRPDREPGEETVHRAAGLVRGASFDPGLQDRAGVTTGLTSSLDTAKARSVEPSCNTCKDTGFVTLRCPCSLPKDPLPEPTIRAAVYGCTDAQCVCGRCPPIKIAVDCSIERVLR